jgi:hypothetical protein
MEKREDHRFIAIRGGVLFVDRYIDRIRHIAESDTVVSLRQIAARIEYLSLEQAESKSAGPATTTLLKERRADIMERYVNPIVSSIERAQRKQYPGDWMDVSKPDPTIALGKFVTQLRVLSKYLKQREEQFEPWYIIPPGFDEAIDTLAQTRDQQGQLRVRSAGATGGIPDLLAKGRKDIDTITTLLIAQVKDPVLIAEWRAATKVRKVPTRVKQIVPVAEQIPAIAAQTESEVVGVLSATIVPETHRLPASTSPQTALARFVQPVRRAIRATATLRLSSGDPEAQDFASKVAARLRSFAGRLGLPVQEQKRQ